jgi:hypothetical protein
MKTKMMTALLVTVLSLAAAPVALEQLNNLRQVAEDWTRNTFLSGIVTVQAAERPAGDRAALVAEPPVSQGATSTDEFRWSGRIAQGGTIEIKGVNGGLRADPTDGSEVEVTAVKSARRSDTRSVEIRVVEHAGGVTICAVYPSKDGGRPNECAPDEGGRMNVNNNDVNVEFKVRVPRGVRFSGRTVNGGIETGALGGDVDARTVNGSITIQAAGIASAMTVNGSITATMGRADWSDENEFKTVNGAIVLNLPSDVSADVSAETLNGEISTDFPMTVLGRISRRHLNGTIGSGGRELSLKTVNGSIHLRRAS